MLTTPLIEIRGLVKHYGGLRPLRVDRLSLLPDEIVVIEGPDEAAAAVLVDLVMGTTLPDEGDVVVAGQVTAAIAGHEAWLAFLEQFGIVNSRVVLLDALSVRQNLALPFTLDLDPVPEAVTARVRELAPAVGLPAGVLDQRLADVSPLDRWRVKLGRALAHDPHVLLIEHPTLGLGPADAEPCARAIRNAAAGRGLAVLAVSSDPRLASKAATRRLDWHAASGRLTRRRSWPSWLPGR